MEYTAIDFRVTNKDTTILSASHILAAGLVCWVLPSLRERSVLHVPVHPEIDGAIAALTPALWGGCPFEVFSAQFVDWMKEFYLVHKRDPRSTAARQLQGAVLRFTVGDAAAGRGGQHCDFVQLNSTLRLSTAVSTDEASPPTMQPPAFEIRDSCRGVEYYHLNYKRFAYPAVGARTYSCSLRCVALVGKTPDPDTQILPIAGTETQATSSLPFLDALVLVLLQAIGITKLLLPPPTGITSGMPLSTTVPLLFRRLDKETEGTESPLFDVLFRECAADEGVPGRSMQLLDALADLPVNEAAFQEPFWKLFWRADTLATTGGCSAEWERRCYAALERECAGRFVDPETWPEDGIDQLEDEASAAWQWADRVVELRGAVRKLIAAHPGELIRKADLVSAICAVSRQCLMEEDALEKR
eukprot:TRINITY_DN2962_c0_g1_i3.p1 TRINITY_DN2962_c0_g1~~TRINITY_DN2962_c0_g1_i3.p1  ORF type:complete len:431 (-),score=56.22 TRINITY_DN2962_c0_g1_i3:227-1471(-)